MDEASGFRKRGLTFQVWLTHGSVDHEGTKLEQTNARGEAELADTHRTDLKAGRALLHEFNQ